MPDLPYPLISPDVEEWRNQILDMFRDIYENRVGGATVGDVFQIGGEVLELKLKSGCGLTKTNGELDIDLTILGSAGGITKSQYTAKGVILIGTGASAYAAKTVGADGSVLKASAADSTGTVWANVTAGEVTNTPAGSIAATTVQAAINELDTEKQAAISFYDQNAEPSLANNTFAFWKDADGAPDYYLVANFGGTQKKVALT
jgi:hypothetical protein